MRKFFAAAAGSAAALAGFAGAANASATIDLIWVGSGTDTTTALSSSTITLQVILTAGPQGSQGGGVTVDFSSASGTLTFKGANNTAGSSILPAELASPILSGSRVEQIGLGSFPPLLLGTSLTSGQSEVLGTVTWHRSVFVPGAFEITADSAGGSDGILDFTGNHISATTTFNSAFLPEPGGLTALGPGIAMLALLHRRRRHSVER